MKRGEEPTRTDLVLPPEGADPVARAMVEDDIVAPVTYCERTACAEAGTQWDGTRWLCERHYRTATCPSRVQAALQGYQAPDIQLTTEEAVARAVAHLASLPAPQPTTEDRLRAENDRLRVNDTQLRLELRDTRLMALLLALACLVLLLIGYFS